MNSTIGLRIAAALSAAILAGPATAQPMFADPAKEPAVQGQNPAGMRVYIRAGLKSHGEGEHDYPQFLADWSKILTEHGAVVDGSFHAPTAEELARTDVIVMYKGDAGYMTDAERAALDAFVKRGGGIIAIHDALCGPDPAAFARYVGAGKLHGQVNFTLTAPITYTITDPASPIMKGMGNITITDEAFYAMTWASNPSVHVLATTVIPDTKAARMGNAVGQVVPQIWTYEHSMAGGKPTRAFVWLQGHSTTNMEKPEIRAMLLRAIAWAARRPVDELVDYKPAPAPEIPASMRSLAPASSPQN
ncbi:MAG: ThuA domain-containing protein [Sphingobium sp.]